MLEVFELLSLAISKLNVVLATFYMHQLYLDGAAGDNPSSFGQELTAKCSLTRNFFLPNED